MEGGQPHHGPSASAGEARIPGRCWPAWSAGKSEFRRAVPLLSEAVGLDVLSAKGLPEVLVSDLLATF